MTAVVIDDVSSTNSYIAFVGKDVFASVVIFLVALFCNFSFSV
jgi:hypothetical protein